MNPFIRLCGLKCRHGEFDLIHRAGTQTATSMCGSGEWWLIGMKLSGHRILSQIAMRLPADLRKARAKSAMGSQPSTLSLDRQTGEGQQRMLMGHDPDDVLAGGASVVVRGGESPLHGEGKQF
jgi:hypothetical protein